MKNKGNAVIVFLIIIASFFTGYLFFKLKNKENTKSKVTAQNLQQKPLKVPRPGSKDHWKGQKNIRYVWIEYSDLQCPYCKLIHPNLVKLLNVYSGKVAWVYRHFPLPFHPKAQKSAEATECATEQKGDEAFWKMTNLIFEKMPVMELSDLPSLASQIGLDKTKFVNCLDSGKFEKKVKDQQSEAVNSGVRATPSSVLYDLKTGKAVLYEGALPYEDLQRILDDFMAKP